MQTSPHHLEFLPLGGLGEFGMNSMLVRRGDDAILIDAGIKYSDESEFGVEAIVPDFTPVADCGNLHGIVLTHGHEDHIGAVPHLLQSVRAPILGNPFTLGLVRRKLGDGDAGPELRRLPEDGATVDLGPFRITPLAAAHSIPHMSMLLIEIDGRRVLHTADFKLAGHPAANESTDGDRLQRLGDAGIDLLLADSTNAGRPGVTPGESTALETLGTEIESAPAAVLVCTFSSHVRRVEGLGRIASRTGRRLALVGASLRAQIGLAEQIGLIQFPAGVQIDAAQLPHLPRNRWLAVVAGSQAEPASAMARISRDEHPDVRLESRDRLLHSARMIPGQERRIGEMLDRVRRLGATVVTASDRPIHVSGHPAADDLRRLLEWTRPTSLLPIHGEFRQLSALRELGLEAGLDPARVPLAESGDRIRLGPDGVEVEPGEAPRTHRVDLGRQPVDPAILLERRWLARGGVVAASIVVDGAGRLVAPPAIAGRGFPPLADGEQAERLIRGAKRAIVVALNAAPPHLRQDPEGLRDTLGRALGRYFRRETQRQPMIVPVVGGPETDGE